MHHRKLVAGLATLSLVAGGTGVALAAGKPPRRADVVAVSTTKVKINRYIQDGLRWEKDTYTVSRAGRCTSSTTPRTRGRTRSRSSRRTCRRRQAIFNCTICDKLGKAHGADPNSEAPPKFPFLENGVGQDDGAERRPPGDSGSPARARRASRST